MTSESTHDQLTPPLAHYSCYRSTPDDAIELFEEARQLCPVSHSDQLGGYHIALNYNDVKTVHSKPETFSSSPTVVLPVAPRPGFPPLEYDVPEHTAWREIVTRAFNADTPARIEPLVRQDISRLIDGFASRGSCDLVADFAEEVPLFAMCHALGFDQEKRGEVRDLTRQLLADFEDPEKGAAAFANFAQFGVAEVARRREEPRGDFLSDLAQAEFDGRPITDDEIGLLMNSFLVAGHGTSVSGLSSLLLEVLSDQAVRDAVRADLSLVPTAIEETLRLHPPFFGLYRRTTEDTTLAGVDLPKDGYLFACWAAANRDPDVYDEPHTFRLDRKFSRRNRHLTFGFGLHACPGAPVARMELRIALEELLTRLPDIELEDPASLRHEFRGTETIVVPSLPARFSAAKA